MAIELEDDWLGLVKINTHTPPPQFDLSTIK